MNKTRGWVLAATLVITTTACGDDEVAFDDTTSTSGGNGASGGAGTGASSVGGTGGQTGGQGGIGPGGTGGGGQGGQVTGGSNNLDPNLDGPYAIAEINDTTTVPSTGATVAIHAAYPSGDSGPFPVVLMGHGFQLPPSQYYSYLTRLASFGYVALTVDFPAGFTGTNHVDNAEELLHGLTWVDGHPMLGPISDTDNAGASGHSLGGKLAILAATIDPRIKATITLDPVDGSMSCSPQNCPDVSNLLPINIPTGFIGETTDASGGFQSCAPAADNFMTFYANAANPTLAVEVLGANHMSFLDDVAGCGITCSFCNPSTVNDALVGALSRSYLVAFYERYLKGDTSYDTYLTGAEAQARYVDSGLATIVAK